MGVVISFAEIKRAKLHASAQLFAVAGDHEREITGAIQAGTDARGILEAARQLLDLCRDRYGFVVMRDGLPDEPAVLARALIELGRGLAMVDAEMQAPRTYPQFGVYFGRRQLVWFEDGYSGETGLAVPDEIEAADLAGFLRPRIAVGRSRSHE